MQLKFYPRDVADCIRVRWDMPESAANVSVEAFVREVRCMDGTQPAPVSHGIASDPIREGPVGHCSTTTLSRPRPRRSWTPR